MALLVVLLAKVVLGGLTPVDEVSVVEPMVVESVVGDVGCGKRIGSPGVG